ncbi:hypothetical protein [Flavobacterium sp.]|jgi:hypothetical protein|uniref:hypothetical protein n=1 Tax=Flavobacterium sp. TaxID=239 RepID=UPI0037C04E5B
MSQSTNSPIVSTYPVYGTVVIPLNESKDESKYFHHHFHPRYVRNISLDKNELLDKINNLQGHYVVPIAEHFKCFIEPEFDEIVNSIRFDMNVDRYINLILSNIFKDEIQEPRRGLTGSEAFEHVYKGVAWFWYMETKDIGLVGMRAFVVHGIIQCEHFRINKSGFLEFTQGGTCVNDAQAFITYIANSVAEKLAHHRRFINNQSALRFEEHSQYPKSNISVGLDFDGTVTSDYHGFAAMAKMMRHRGHKVYLVTMRYQSECLRDKAFMELASELDGYIHTDRQAKKTYCKNKGIHIHIWIDDNPEAVYKSAAEIWGTPSVEGSVVIEQHSN